MLHELQAELKKLTSSGHHKDFHVVNNRRGGFIEIKGKTLLDFSNWDFLNLNQHQKIKRAAQVEIEKVGISPGSPRLVSGTRHEHLACEKRLAQFLGTESALLFSSKNQAILSLVAALASDQDVLIFDELIQSPVADAGYLVHAQLSSFPTGKLDALEKELEKTTLARRRFVFIESISPLTGSASNLEALFSLTARYEAFIMLDESYALGGVGARGAGVGDQYKNYLGASVLCYYSDLSLGLASYGAVVAGPATLTGYLINRSRTIACESALPSLLTNALQTAVDIMELKLKERELLNALAEKLWRGIYLLRPHLPPFGGAPIVNIPFDKLSVAQEFGHFLLQKGFFVEVISSPKPFHQDGIVRFILNSAHTERQIDELLGVLGEALPKIDSR